MSDHTRTEELIAAYALDAVEPGEALEVSRELIEHVCSCWTCPRLFGDLRATAGDLALAAPPCAITLAMRDRVMNAVRAENRPSVTRGRQNSLVRALLVASVGLALGLGGLSASLSSQLGETRGERPGRSCARLRQPSLDADRKHERPNGGRPDDSGHPPRRTCSAPRFGPPPPRRPVVRGLAPTRPEVDPPRYVRSGRWPRTDRTANRF